MNVCLSIMAPSDQLFLREVRSNPLVADWLFSPARAITPEEQQAWYEKASHDPYHLVWIARANNPDIWRYVRYGQRVGYGQLYDIDMQHMTCELGIAVVPFYQGEGIGGQIVDRLLYYAFEMIGLRSVTALLFCDNSAALMMFGRCGFQVRGWLPEAKFKRGEYRDLFVMSILKGDYERDKVSPRR